MATYGGSFESTSSIDERKESKRKARQDALHKAKQQYEKEEQRKELKRLRGEDTWMLPDVNLRLEQIEEEGSVKSKKKKEKKSKKAKKEKKKNKKGKKEKSKAEAGHGSDDSSEDSEDQWVEAKPQQEAAKACQSPAEDPSPDLTAQRDDWMTFDFLAMRTTSTTEKRAEKERLKEEERAKAQAIEQAGLHKLELNPFWKDGGTGLPPQEKPSTAEKTAGLVDDGGLSWLRKSYQRMSEQAEREQRSLDEVVSQRYGSMEQFQKRLALAEEKAYGQRRGGPRDQGPPGRGGGGGGWRRGGETDRDRERGGVDRRGGETDRVRERGGGDRRGGETDRDRERGGGDRRGGETDRDRERGGERHGAADRDRWRRSERDGNASPRDRQRDGREDDRHRERDGGSERDKNRDRERDRERGGDRDGDGERDRDRDRNRDRERDGGRARAPDRGEERHHARRESPSGGHGRGHAPLSSRGSLKGRFLKPSEEDEDAGLQPLPSVAPTRPSAAFKKPGSDDDDDDEEGSDPRGRVGATRVPAWKKSGGQSDPAERAEHAGIAPPPPDAPRHGGNDDKAAVTSSSSSSSSSESEAEELPLLTDEEMNKLGAKLVKAEIMENTAMVEKLKSQLEAARKAREVRAARQKLLPAAVQTQQVPGRSEEDQEVLLFRTDQSGRAWPVNASSGPQEPRGGRRKKKLIETHVEGERVRYFQDDDDVGLREMVRREKMSTAQDQNALYSRMAAKMMGKTDGDNYTLDDMFVSSSAQREGEGREEDRMRSRAVAEHRRLAATMDKCPHCFNSQELQKHLLVAIGSKVYLSLSAGVSMAEGHCLICPLQHHCSATGLDEDVWTEMQLFRRALVRVFEAQEMDCVFMETHMNPRRRQHMVLECIPLLFRRALVRVFEAQEMDCVFMETHMNPRRRQHMVLECIPLPRELGDMAPIYFKKAILESDEEWAMNKKLVELSKKDIRQAIPRGLPYFAVDFGLQGGFAHVIENEHKFPHYFGKEIVGGMMDLEPRRWRKPIRENFDDQRKKVLQFAQWWKPFDCTKTHD